MLKRDITYTNFDGEEVTETFYFNLTKTELMEMQIDTDGGLAQLIERIIEERNVKGLYGLFKDIVLGSYGIRSEDGKRFIKNDQVREEFTQTAAYDALVMEISSNDEAAAAFIIAVVPADLADEAQKAIEKEKSIDVPLPLADVSQPST